MKLTLIAILTLSALVVTGQTRTFKWSDDACSYLGTYNASRYTQGELANTRSLMEPGAFDLTTDDTVFNYDEIKGLSVEKLDLEFNTKSAKLRALKIVNSPYWEGFRQRKLREMQQVYALARVTIRAYSDPTALNAYDRAESCKTQFAGPLIAGGDQLLAVWQTVNEASRKNNGDPDRIRRIYEEQRASPDRAKFALVEVMAFGWFNCANRYIENVQMDETPIKEFKRLFIRVKAYDCEV